MNAINRLLMANGSRVDLETANYYSDHGIHLQRALELARTARADRPGIYGDDALAWALERNDRCEEALLALGAGAPSRDARREPLLPQGDDRALPRRRGGRARLVPQGARSQPELLAPVGTHREGGDLVKKLLLLAGLALALLAPGVASAHPLGNFTVNHFSRVQPSGDRVYVLYVLDMAEIPTFQDKHEARDQPSGWLRRRAGRQGPRGTRPLRGRNPARAEGAPPCDRVPRRRRRPRRRPGSRSCFEAGPSRAPRHARLPGRVVRAEARLARDRDRTGRRCRGRGLERSGRERERRAARTYPQDLLSSPLDVRSATGELSPGDAAGPPPALLDGEELEAQPRTSSASEGGFASLISKENLSAGFIVALALRRALLGCGARPQPGSRQGDRRRLPDRRAGDAAPRRSISDWSRP